MSAKVSHSLAKGHTTLVSEEEELDTSVVQQGRSGLRHSFSLRRSFFGQIDPIPNLLPLHASASPNSPVELHSLQNMTCADRKASGKAGLSGLDRMDGTKNSSDIARAGLPDPFHSAPAEFFSVRIAGHCQNIYIWRKVRVLLIQMRNYILQVREYCPDPEGRHIFLDLNDICPQIQRLSGKPYIDNQITSSRYTLFNFLPRQLAFQFSKVANIYFLSISILQMIPGLSTTGTYTTIIPLAIFICIAMAREGYDDIRRHKMDTAENNSKTTVLRVENGSLAQRDIKWRNLHVGDVVKLSKDDWVPADMILLRSSGLDGIAYIETAALDGETNLKSKRAISLLADKCDYYNVHEARINIHTESPNQDLYNYEGKCTVSGQECALTSDQIIYRGSILRNTTELFGIVIFTGEETKIRLNASKNLRTKRPTMQNTVNNIVLAIVFFVICLAIFCTCGYYIWHNKIEENLWYLSTANTIAFLPIFVSFIILFNTMVPLSLYVSMEIVKLIQLILLQQDMDLYHEQSNTPAEARTSTINEELGQISYIFTDKTGTLTNNEMVFRRLSVAGHSWLHDLDMQPEIVEERPFLYPNARNGQVKRKYSDQIDQEPSPAARRSASRVWKRHSIGLGIRSSTSTVTPDPLINEFSLNKSHSTSAMIEYIQAHPHTIFARRTRLLLLSIALCHTALPEPDPDSDMPSFSAASPDEIALVNAAQDLGYVMIQRSDQSVTLKTHPRGLEQEAISECYKIHDIIEFSSSRKRMSVIVELPDGRFCVFCKGADSVLLDRMRLKDLAKRKWNEVDTLFKNRQSIEAEHVIARKSFARPSLARTSLHSISRLESIRNLDEYLNYRRGFRQGQDDYEVPKSRSSTQYRFRHSLAIGESTSPLQRTTDHLVNDSLARNDGLIFQHTFEQLHSFASEGLRTLLYGHRFLPAEEYHAWKKVYHEAKTSLADRQLKIEQAGELIETQFDLTGATAIEDKLQDGVVQAIEKLSRAGIKLWMLTGDKRETAINIGHSAGFIKDYSTTIILDHEDPGMLDLMTETTLQIASGSVAHSVVIIEGDSLASIENDAAFLSMFMTFVVAVDSVICCRASPAQKALIVRQIRKKITTSITLAIGDGANDIAMIKEAHVGIGITGKEGLQAARASDYSIAQFRFLVKLLLVHGRWNYMRISKYILGTFYKEMLLFLTQAVFQRFVGYTGTSLHESWSLSLFNTLFSSLAVICIGSFEKDLSSSTLLAVPELYATSRTASAFSIRIMLLWITLAATQAVVGFYLAYYSYAYWVTPDLFPFGEMIFTAIVIVINVKLIFLEMHSWSIINYTFFVVSFFGWWLWSLLQAAIYSSAQIYFVKDAFILGFGREVEWWAGLLLVVTTMLAIDIGAQAVRSAFWPTEEDVFREMQTDSALKARLEEEAAMEQQTGWIEDLLREREDRPNVSMQDNFEDTTVDHDVRTNSKSDVFISRTSVT